MPCKFRDPLMICQHNESMVIRIVETITSICRIKSILNGNLSFNYSNSRPKYNAKMRYGYELVKSLGKFHNSFDIEYPLRDNPSWVHFNFSGDARVHLFILWYCSVQYTEVQTCILLY